MNSLKIETLGTYYLFITEKFGSSSFGFDNFNSRSVRKNPKVQVRSVTTFTKVLLTSYHYHDSSVPFVSCVPTIGLFLPLNHLVANKVQIQ